MSTKAENIKLWDQLREVPDKAKKPITGGRMRGMTDISPMWRWHHLTERFGPCGVGWRYEITDIDRQVFESSEEVVLLVRLNLWYQTGDGWSEPIPGVGGAKLASMERGGLYIDDDATKKATTDALGVAAKMIGLGSDVYSQNADWTKYSGADEPKAPATSEPQSDPHPSKHPPPSEKEMRAKKYAEILAWLESGKATEKQIAGMIARSAELVQDGSLSQRDQRKLHTEFLIHLSEWDQAQEHLVRMQSNSYLTKKQVDEYMVRVDAGRGGGA